MPRSKKMKSAPKFYHRFETFTIPDDKDPCLALINRLNFEMRGSAVGIYYLEPPKRTNKMGSLKAGDEIKICIKYLHPV